MKKSLIALALVGAFSVPAFAEEAPASPHTVTGNVALVSDYIFRGISQTQHKAALQGGFDYSHASGLYAGVWASNVAWVKETNFKDNSSLEVDFYGGYKGSFAEDFSYDLGVLRYYYPGDLIPGATNTNSTEVYASIGWKFITLKYNYTVSSYLFGWEGTAYDNQKTRGSGYLDLSANYDLGSGWGINGHVGHQDIKHNSDASYTDWKLGVTKDVGFGVVGLAYTGSDAKFDSALTNVNYNWAGKNVGKDVLFASFGKTF